MKPKRPVIIVQTNPQEIEKGGMLTISARLFDPKTNQPMTVSRIFMNIVSKKDGHVVWPLEVVRKDTDKFDIQIGTNDMKEGHEYFLRVSNNWNMSPNGATTFKVSKNNTTPIVLFPVPFPRRNPTDDLLKKEIEKFIFRTQMDARVCPICIEFQNQEFGAREPKPTIPLHFNCRCTYDVIFKDIVIQQLNAVMEEMAEVLSVAKKYRQMREMNDMFNLINMIEEIENVPVS